MSSISLIRFVFEDIDITTTSDIAQISQMQIPLFDSIVGNVIMIIMTVAHETKPAAPSWRNMPKTDSQRTNDSDTRTLGHSEIHISSLQVHSAYMIEDKVRVKYEI